MRTAHSRQRSFPDRASAERGYDMLTERGYGKEDVNLAMSAETRKTLLSSGVETELGTKAAEGAGVGGAIGGTLGAIAAAVAAIGASLVLPGLGQPMFFDSVPLSP